MRAVLILSTVALIGVVMAFEEKPVPPVFTEHLIADKYGYAFGAAAADLDGDKRLDVIATAERGANELRWWRNGVKKR